MAEVLDPVTVTPYEPGHGLPLFIEPVADVLAGSLDSAVSWFREAQDPLRERIAEAGAVVLRGFPVHTSADFGRLVEHLPSTEYGYIGGNTRRDAIEGRVMEATRLPSSEKITLHQEMAYMPEFPDMLAFFCRVPADTGGETILCDMRAVVDLIDQDLVAGVRRLGVLYVRNFRAPESATGDPLLDSYHKTWVEAFWTQNRDEVSESCRSLGLEHIWESDGSLTTKFRTAGLVPHPLTGQETWFNHVHAMSFIRGSIGDQHLSAHEAFYPGSDMREPFQVFFGDGSEIPEDAIRSIYPVLDRLTVAFPWRHGDVLLVDNIATAHGRNPFTGDRDVQVALIR